MLAYIQSKNLIGIKVLIGRQEEELIKLLDKHRSKDEVGIV